LAARENPSQAEKNSNVRNAEAAENAKEFKEEIEKKKPVAGQASS